MQIFDKITTSQFFLMKEVARHEMTVKRLYEKEMINVKESCKYFTFGSLFWNVCGFYDSVGCIFENMSFVKCQSTNVLT